MRAFIGHEKTESEIRELVEESYPKYLAAPSIEEVRERIAEQSNKH